MDRERERESLEFTSFTRVCFVTRYNFFFFLVILINQFLENYKDSFISTVNKEISLVNARMCEKMNWEGSWTEIGQSEWGMEGYLGGWPRRAMLELPNDDSKFLGNCSFVIHEFSPTSLSLFLSLSSNPSLYRIEDIPLGDSRSSLRTSDTSEGLIASTIRSKRQILDK